MIKQIALLSGAFFGFAGVALGAFGAHALKSYLTQHSRLDVFDLAIEYQFYHALALLATGILMHIMPSVKFKYAAICFITGIVFFSGSLYTLCFTGLGIFGMVTPIGGLLMILGWSFLFVGVLGFRKNKKSLT